MNKKTKNGVSMACPVPPWTPKNIVKLAQYLGVSQAKMTEMLGISYSALRAWIDGRSKSISQNILSRLKKFEPKISSLRKKAHERFNELATKEERKKSRLPKPWPVSRIRAFMHTWGMSQVELALFAGVSYDTVTSWSRGRRRLVRKETADHLANAEKVAVQRGFPKRTANSKENPWVGVRKFSLEETGVRLTGEAPKQYLGQYTLEVIERKPGEFRAAKKNEVVVIAAGKKKDQVIVKMTIGKKNLKFNGVWQKLGGVKVIELQAEAKDSAFMEGKAGCINPSKNGLRVSLWSSSELPVRLSAIPVRKRK